MKKKLNKYFTLFLLLLFIIFSGCRSRRCNVSIEVSGYYWKDKIYVDVGCIENYMYDQYSSATKENFWSEDSSLRTKIHGKSFIFDINSSAKQRLSKNDSIWNFWKNDDYMIVFAELPSNAPWKLIIPLDYYSPFNFWSERDKFFYISKKGIVQLDKEIEHKVKPKFISDEDMNILMEGEGLF